MVLSTLRMLSGQAEGTRVTSLQSKPLSLKSLMSIPGGSFTCLVTARWGELGVCCGTPQGTQGLTLGLLQASPPPPPLV